MRFWDILIAASIAQSGTAGVPATPSLLLMETGDFLLLESGDKIELE